MLHLGRLLIVIWLLALVAPLQATDTTWIRQVHVVDVVAGTVTKDQAIQIKDGKIVAIIDNQAAKPTAEAKIIDGEGTYAMPGLWDMHVQLFDNDNQLPPRAWSFPLFLSHGVIGVREMWANPGLDQEQISRWRERAEDGAPHFGAVGTMVDGEPPIHASAVLRSPEQAAGFVNMVKQAGFDFIKVYDRLNPDTFKALAQAAREANIPLVGHLPSSMNPLAALETGLQSIEHSGTLLPAITVPPEQETPSNPGAGLQPMQGPPPAPVLKQEKLDTLTETLLKTKTAVVPTLALRELQLLRNDPGQFDKEDGLRYTPGATVGQWYWFRDAIFGTPPEVISMQQKVLNMEAQMVVHLHKAGVPILAGSNFGAPYVYPGFSLIDELEALHAAGLSTADAIRSATSRAAAFLELSDQYGSLAVGKAADLILVAGNPLTDLGHLRALRGLHFRGSYFDQAALTAMRQERIEQKLLAAVRRPAVPRRKMSEQALSLYAGDYSFRNSKARVSVSRGGLRVLFNGNYMVHLEPLGGGVFRKPGSVLLYSFQAQPDGQIWGFSILDRDVVTFRRE